MRTPSRRYGVIVTAALLLAVTYPPLQISYAQTSCTPPIPNMVAWYPGDGNALDVQGGSNGTVVGTVSFPVARVGQGFQTTSGFVNVPNDALLRPPAAVTVEAWVQATNPTFSYIVSKSFNSGTGSYAFYSGGSVGLQFYILPEGSGFVASPAAIGASIWDGQLHHIAGTYDGSFVRLYVDGVQVGNGTPTSGAIRYARTYQNGDLLIGAFNSDGGLRFPGVIDELTIYSRALTQSEIQAIYDAGSAGKCKSILGAVLTRDAVGDLVARVTLNNPTTDFTATNVTITLARASTLDETAFVDGVPAPQFIGTVAPNQNATRTVTFPGTAGVPPGFTGLIRVNLTLDGGSFSLTQQVVTP